MAERRNLLTAGLAAGAALPALAAPNLASAQPRVRWRCPGSFPKSLDTLYGGHEFLCRRVSEMTEGAFQIQPFGPGELVPALQVMDAVGAGTVECGITLASYYIGKDPALAIGACLPFGLNSRQTWSWLHFGGGRQALAPVYGDQGVHAIPALNTAAQMGGWYRREIRGVADLQGLKMRIAGLGGAVMAKLGVVPQQIAGGDIYPALERGVIDAAEWVGPHDDEKLGFNRVAPFYYYPGFWEASPSTDLLVNLRAWEALPATFKAVLDAACAEAWHWVVGRYDAQNPAALRRLIAAGTQPRAFPREVLLAAHRASQELYAELGAANPRFRAIHEGWDRYRQDQQSWFRVAEDSQANILTFIASQQRGQ
mgnify:CR=1 FL=1